MCVAPPNNAHSRTLSSSGSLATILRVFCSVTNLEKERTAETASEASEGVTCPLRMRISSNSIKISWQVTDSILPPAARAKHSKGLPCQRKPEKRMLVSKTVTGNTGGPHELDHQRD